ncbi:hypothetical protein I350_04424 [Cryptococcus amylolentus CBS 6273]|uniref:Thaumatin-like protein 1 n=1 Tax=Cryptococcus amylolentus CBS 6273 TaxID=1296118 RepID=A0A1E3K1Z0_9TREE|nr:hypothetical protein I350_04424 [Cryptococcus amylolentus CBS 6273]
MLSLLLIPLLSSLAPLSHARQITVKNSCSSTIWPGMHTGAGEIPDQVTGWELAAGDSTIFEVPENWQAGRIWGRTECVIQDGKFQCLTGQCGSGEGGNVTCENSDQPPATLAEFTMQPDSEDNFDISLVDGFNLPLNIIPSIASCPQPQCQVNINLLCPAMLRTALDMNGVNLGCLTACNAGLGQEMYGNRACCTGSYADSDLCQACGVDYYSLFKDNCNTSYAYAYDEKSKTALWTCSNAPDYIVEFCPAGSDYVGAKTPSDAYVNATATCSSLASTGLSTFSVGPSPTGAVSSGTLSVVATVATGVDGAAAIQVGATESVDSASSAVADSDSSTAAAATATAGVSAETGIVASSAAAPVQSSVSEAAATSAAVEASSAGVVASSAGVVASSAGAVESSSADIVSQAVTPASAASTSVATGAAAAASSEEVTSAAALGAQDLAEGTDTVTTPTSTVIVTQYVTIQGEDPSSSEGIAAVQAATSGGISSAAASGDSDTEVFTVVDGSTLVQVVNHSATTASGTGADGVAAVEASQTGGAAGSSGAKWGEGSWLSAVPSGHEQQRKVYSLLG